METILAYFETIPSSHRSLILVGGISFFWIIEGAVPLFDFKYKKWKHAIPNLFFTGTTIIINVALAFLLLRTADWVTVTNFGIINWLPEMPLWLYALLGVLLLDFFGAYLAHFTEHKIKLLWMVHLVHHTDHKVDTTTANRHHPLESIIRFAFTLLGVFIVGTPIAIVMLYQSMSLIFTQLTHANIKMPRKLDKLLSYFIVSPDMHKVHHHNLLPYTDANYGNIFSIWDRLLGTYMELDREKIVYGVDTFPNEVKNGEIKELLKQPFQGYRRPTNIEEL
ncbi:sterol desaturase family protein [Tenacibaculum maritimum]|uniref:Sterol desaturase-related protein n=1 Tax=Tenacibaculum maritimum NCIMB 2154 TaxID=1349785 RepID=A0A2H1EBV6_9FLAO|nr:sterol desaturase family protein [Tenacibaculum maritimum]MCD9564004.1 sterol desaturase family protein [Tenacibaculum maritimum]MCD9566907.1 sterol desaturase family protein [Tenacibaculum maritimum]MCD9580186.1 sterol desaturase family protein [Tenacibaculum maritimum]MCD9585940.1 sterol desaturase family protein [Tenacibaculum maritimum]MCD9597849.1 sterol desaturase family protein [Tenacibaculum maritimum]